MDSGKENDGPLHRFTKDIHVHELYLARRGLTTLPDVSRLFQLRFLWLNNNRIKIVHGHVLNCCLAELYLQNNDINSVSGALKHLTCLRVLMLHNNQMKNLEETVAELKHMQSLQNIKVRQEERRLAFRVFCPDRQRFLDTLAFSRRAPMPPVGRKVSRGALTLTGSHNSKKKYSKQVKGTFDGVREPHENRSMGRSIMQFSTVDWCGMTRAQQRPLEEWSSTAPNILTVQYR